MLLLSRRVPRFLLCLWVAVLLSSCTVPERRPPEAAAPAVAEYPADLQGARLYRLAPEQSTLHILVLRGGTMAHLGHNHVISSTTMSGYIWLHDALARSGFNITLPVNDLIIDDPQARQAEGAEFATVVTDAARTGTRNNMLKPEQLDGEHYPLIRLRSLAIDGAHDQPQVRVSITIKDQTRELLLPVTLSASEKSIQTSGQFQIKLSEFGITPYSVALGALQVQDQLTIKFDLIAIQSPSP